MFFIEKISRWLNRRTLYPLVLGPWRLINTPEAISNLINSGYFRTYLKSVEPELGNIRKVLVFAPHQDDEAIGCGGLLIRLKEQATIKVAYMTDGAQEVEGISIDEIVTKRNLESKNALNYCSAKGIYLGIPNIGLHYKSEYILKIKDLLIEEKPDLILTPWLFDRPWKHRLCNVLIYEALKNTTELRNLPIWSYQIHNVVFPNIVVDITEQINDKIKMIKCYNSQITNAPYDHYIAGMNQWNSQYLGFESKGFAEIYFGIPVKDWVKLLDSIILKNREKYINKP